MKRNAMRKKRERNFATKRGKSGTIATKALFLASIDSLDFFSSCMIKKKRSGVLLHSMQERNQRTPTTLSVRESLKTLWETVLLFLSRKQNILETKEAETDKRENKDTSFTTKAIIDRVQMTSFSGEPGKANKLTP